MISKEEDVRKALLSSDFTEKLGNRIIKFIVINIHYFVKKKFVVCI